MAAEDPVPVRRGVIGCLAIVVLVGALLLLVRPLIFTFAPPRDDANVVLATATEVGGQPVRRDVVLTRSYDLDGEVDAGDGRVQVSVLATRDAVGGVAVVNAASPVQADCDVTMGGGSLVDCGGRTWAFDGTPLEAGLPPLERFPARVEDGAVVVDMTRTEDR